MHVARESLIQQIMSQTGGLVVITDEEKVIVPAHVGQTKSYTVENFRRDYESPDAAAVARVLIFLNNAAEATKKIKGRLAYISKCLPDFIEVMVFNLKAKRMSERFLTERLLLKHDAIQMKK